MNSFRTIDDVLNFAIIQETKAHDFYLELADWVETERTSRTLQNFADEELTHLQKLLALKKGNIKIEAETIGSLDIADKLEPIEAKENMGYAKTLIYAIKKEDRANKLYSSLAEACEDPEIKEMFLLLAQQEANHRLGLELEYDLATF
jgi:rubrerythrin